MIKQRKLFLMIFLTISVFRVFSEEPEIQKLNIAVFPVINRSGHKELNKAADKIKSVSEQTLLLLGGYNVINETGSYPPGQYLNYCNEKGVDYIIYGDLIKQERNIIFELYVFSREAGAVTISGRETAESPVRLRETIKKTISNTLGNFTGKEINFTSLAFTNMTDEKGDYSVYIDGILFGKNIEYLESLLSGTRNVKILQKRIFGTYNAGEINAVLLPEDRVSVEFKIPPVLENEKKYIDRYSQTVNKHIDDKYYSQKVSSSFEKLFMLLENPEFSDTAVRIKEEISRKYHKWRSNMEKWGASKGYTTADKPYSLGFKTMFLVSSFDINDWDMGGTDPDSSSGTGMGFGFTGSADIFKFLGLQAEVLVCNQKTKTLYPSGYPVLNLSEIETSTWFFEAPALIYLRVPENLVKLYGGVSYKYRITPLRLEGEVIATSEHVSKKYDDENLRMHLPSWLAGFAIEYPFRSSVFTIDFRYNRDFRSWFDTDTPEEDFIAQYMGCSLGYTAKF